MKNKMAKLMTLISSVLFIQGCANDGLKLQFTPNDQGVWVYVFYENKTVPNAEIKLKDSDEIYLTDKSGRVFIRTFDNRRKSIEVKITSASGESLSKTAYLPFFSGSKR